MKPLILILTLIFCVFGQQPHRTWRVLNVFTNTMGDILPELGNYRLSSIQPQIDVTNTIYENSQISTRAELAGIIWDTTYIGATNHIVMGDASLHFDKYKPLLEKYSADVLWIWNDIPGQGGSSTKTWDSETSYGSPIVVLGTTGDGVLVHEVGHSYRLDHCDGYRQTYDINGDFTHELGTAVSGFNSNMAYVEGYSWCAYYYPNWSYDNEYFNGDLEFRTEALPFFANLHTQWTDPNTGKIHTIGREFHNPGPLIEARNDTIVNWQMTPDELILDEATSIRRRGYGNFLAINKVIIQSGFKVQAGSELRISVGPQVKE